MSFAMLNNALSMHFYRFLFGYMMRFMYFCIVLLWNMSAKVHQKRTCKIICANIQNKNIQNNSYDRKKTHKIDTWQNTGARKDMWMQRENSKQSSCVDH